jgi:ABC-type xylose transport system permease subunit
MPNRKVEKRRRKLRVHGPSPDAVGTPPTGRKAPRTPTTSAPSRGQRSRAQRSPRELAVPSIKRSARKGGFMAIFMVGIVVVTTRSHGTGAVLIALAETVPLIFLFVIFDLWMARKVYKRVTGEEAPR